MSSRQRYQYGCLTRMRRVRNEDIWQFRYYETTGEGQRQRRARTIGTVAQYPTKADALRVIEPFRLRLNLQHRFARPTTLRNAPAFQTHVEDGHPVVIAVTHFAAGHCHGSVDLSVAQEFSEERRHELLNRLHAYAALHGKYGRNTGFGQTRPQRGKHTTCP